jgi:hypothetical protein
MSNTLTITTSLANNNWEITGGMSEGTLPSAVFIYENSGSGVLGTYVGVCSVDELTRLQVFSGNVVPMFANKYLRANTLNIVVSIGVDTIPIIDTIVAAVTSLSKAYKATTTVTQVYTI